MDERVCKKCGELKPANEFFRYRDRKGEFRLKARCKVCIRPEKRVHYHNSKEKIMSSRQKYYVKNRDTIRAKVTAKKLGIELEVVVELRQITSCQVCGRTEEEEGRALAIDHCHNTGDVRGVLCSRCNVALGLLSDDIRTVKNLLDYLSLAKKDRDG